MSSFTARNLSDDELDIEEHTRELQIEIALNILNKALNAQKLKDYKTARINYDELGHLEILKSQLPSNNPIIDRLKYLHSRNRGFLRIHELIETKKLNENNHSIIYDEIIGAINDLLNAITYADPDEKSILLLGALFTHFGHNRLARLCYELKLPSINHTLLLNDSKIVHSYIQLLEKLHLNQSKIHIALKNSFKKSAFTNIITSKYPKFNWNDILTRQEWDNEHTPTLSENILQIDIDIINENLQLESFWNSWSNTISKPRGKNKYPDAYTFTDDRIRDIKINFNNVLIDDSIDKPPDELEDDEKFVDALDYVDEQITSTTIPSRPVRNLRGKTDVLENIDALHYDVKNLDMFVSSILPDFLKHFNISLNLEQLTTALIDDNPEFIKNQLERKFYNILTQWDDDATQSLHIIDNNKNNKINSINELLNIQQTKLIIHSKYTPVPYNNLRILLTELSNSKTHFHLFRSNIFEFFTNSHESYKFNSIITTVKLSKLSIKTFKNLVDSVSISYYKQIQNNLLYNSNPCPHNLNIAISILESLLDSYLEFINDQKLKKSTLKTVSEITFFETTTQKQLKLWFNLVDDYFTLLKPSTDLENYLWIKYKWLHINYIQISPEQINSQILMEWLIKMKKLSIGKDYYQPFINFEFIPILDNESIDNQYSKLKILEIFNKNEKSNEILESILLNIETTYANNEIKSQLTTFLENSNLQMKLRLWSLLLRYCRVNKNLTNYKKSFEKIINILIDQLNDITDDSKTRILNVIGFFTFFTKQFIEVFCESNETVKQIELHDIEISKTMVKYAASLLHLFYIFLMHKKLASIDNLPDKLSKSKKSNELIEDAISSCFFIISSYISNSESSKKPELINDLLSMCHVHLGLRNRCNSLNGNFLFFLQCKLSKLDFNISTNDMFQIIHCRFGFPVTIDKFETFDHKCKPSKLNLTNAIQLSNYISTYCFRGKHPVQSPPKNDIKNIIDNIIDVVGNNGMTNEDVVTNKKLFDLYLSETKIDLSFIIKVFNGEFNIDFAKPNFSGVEIVQDGLFYLQGLVGINFFKVRKRTVQSRVSELEPVSTILKRDLYCGTNRFETWVSLGQIYSYVVEDDLIWTADKLNSLEKKQITALSQKNSLLCYLMAISIYVKASDEQKLTYKPVLNSLWESFSKELYNAWMQPMNKKAFHSFQVTKIIDSNKKLNVIESVSNDIPTPVILKLLEMGFQNAIKYDEKNWYNYMYLAKSKYKMRNMIDSDLPSDEIIELMTKACCLAYEQSNKEDPIIEPHYYRISMIIKLWTVSKLTPERATELLITDPLFKDVPDLYVPQRDFVDTILVVLDKLISYDKKNWQHRPVYRRAKILEEMKHDTTTAKEEMLKMINLKPSVRSLSTIWKPIYERPGKHFIYNAIYTKFLTALLYKMGNLYSLIVLLKKIRRAGVVMVNLTKIFDDMTLRICTLIKKSIKLKNGYLEDILTRVSYKDFIKYSPKFIDFMKQETEFNKETLLDLFFLSEMQNFRKLATGFGATSLIDEVFHSLYMKLFVPYLFKILVKERNGGLKVSEILTKAKDFKLEKALSEHKSRTTTPDTIQQSNTEKTTTVTLMEAELWDIGTDLSEADQFSIIAYLSFKDIVTTPTKDKVKLARRDISPFAIKLILATTKPVDKLKEETNDGETINYNIPQILDDSELAEIASQMNSKETKENKEEKEFDKLIAEHERSLSDEELNVFNSILQKFGIKELVKFTPPQKLDVSPGKLILSSDPAKDNSISSEKDVETINVIPNENNLQKDAQIGEIASNLLEKKSKVTSQPAPHNETTVQLAVQSVVENISPPISQTISGPVSESLPMKGEEHSKFVATQNSSESTKPSVHMGDFEPYVEHAVANVANTAFEVNADENDESSNANTLIKQTNHRSEVQDYNLTFPDAVVNVLETAQSNSYTEPTQDTKEPTSIEAKSKEPSPKKQPVITSFFKVSPEKNYSVNKRENDSMVVNGSPELKRRRLIDPEEDFNKYKQSLDSLSLPSSSDNFFGSLPLRRNSRRQLLHADLVELANTGNTRPQRAKKKSTDIVEVLSDSDSNTDSVIVID